MLSTKLFSLNEADVHSIQDLATLIIGSRKEIGFIIKVGKKNCSSYTCSCLEL